MEYVVDLLIYIVVLGVICGVFVSEPLEVIPNRR